MIDDSQKESCIRIVKDEKNYMNINLCTLFVCMFWPGKGNVTDKEHNLPLSITSINGQRTARAWMERKERERVREGAGAGSGVSVWQDLLLISESFIHRLVINSPLNTSFSSPLRPRRRVKSSGAVLQLASKPIVHQTFFFFQLKLTWEKRISLPWWTNLDYDVIHQRKPMWTLHKATLALSENVRVNMDFNDLKYNNWH